MLPSVSTRIRAAAAAVESGSAPRAGGPDPVVSVEIFCKSLAESDLPLSVTESFTLAQLLRRGGSGRAGDVDMVDTSLLQKIKKGEFLSMELQKLGSGR